MSETPTQFNSTQDELLFFKRGYRDRQAKLDECGSVIKGLLDQLDSLRDSSADTQRLVDENQTLKRQNAELLQELETTKQTWMADVAKHIAQVETYERRIRDVERALAVFSQQVEAEKVLLRAADRFDAVHKNLVDVAVVLARGTRPAAPADTTPWADDEASALVNPPSDITTEPSAILSPPRPAGSPRAPRARPVVAFTGVSDEAKPRLLRALRAKGGVFESSLTGETTHVVAHHKITTTCLRALLAHLWIVPPEWVLEGGDAFPAEVQYTKRTPFSVEGKRFFFSPIFEAKPQNKEVKALLVGEGKVVVVNNINACDVALIGDAETRNPRIKERVYTLKAFLRALPFPPFLAAN